MKETPAPIKILISTGIYPPAIGGPALYAKSLFEEFQRGGHVTRIKTFGSIERKLPSGLRHLFYFFKIVPAVVRSDVIIALDTFSVGLPSVFAALLFGKKIIIRTGGDFLWEGYVERTGQMVLLRNFYDTTKDKWNTKERAIYKLTKFVLKQASAIVFSTKWQQDIFNKAYGLDLASQFIIENFYGAMSEKPPVFNKDFIGSTRPLKWKNLETLRRVFEKVKKGKPEISLTTLTSPHENFLERIRSSYAVIVMSLGDISPNTILDAISVGTPFILTKENGLMDRIGSVGLFADPLDEKDIEDKVLWLLKPENYRVMQERLAAFGFTHTWSEIAEEFLSVFRAVIK